MNRRASRSHAPLVLVFACVACGGAQPTATTTTPVAPIVASFLDPEDTLAEPVAASTGTAQRALVPQNVHRSLIRSIVADPLGRYFVALDDDAVVSLHDAATGQVKAVERAAIRRTSPPDVSIDASGTRIAVGVPGGDVEGARAFAWDLVTGAFREVTRASAAMYAMRVGAISPDGTRIYALSAHLHEDHDETFVEVRDFGTGRRTHGPFTVANVRSLAVAPTGGMLLVHTFEPDALLLLESASLEALGRVEGVTADPAFRPQGGQMVIATETELVVRSPRDGRVLGSVSTDARVERILYAADGECLVTHATDGSLRVRRASTLEIEHTANVGEIAGLLALPACGGALVVTQSGELRRHRPGIAEEGELVATPAPAQGSQYGGYGGPVADVGHGRLAMGVGEDIVLLDATTGQEQLRISGGAGERSVWNVRFSASGDALYVSGRGFLDVWDAASARRTSCEGPERPISLAGGHVLVAGSDGLCDPENGTTVEGYVVSIAETAPVLLATFGSRHFLYDAARRTRGPDLLAPGTRDCPAGSDRCGEVGIVSADGTRVAIARHAPNRVFIYDSATSRKIATLSVEEAPSALHFNADASAIHVVGATGIRAYPVRGGRATTLATFERPANVSVRQPSARHVYIEVGTDRAIYDLERGQPVVTFDDTDRIIEPTATRRDAFTVSVDGRVAELVVPERGQRIALGERRFLGVSDDLSRMATCTEDTLHVVRLDVDAEPVAMGTCALVDEAIFRPDGQVIALRQGTRVALRTPEGAEVILRATRSATDYAPFASNARGEHWFPDAAGTSVCLRSSGTLVDASCALSPTEGRVQSVTAPFFAP